VSDYLLILLIVMVYPDKLRSQNLDHLLTILHINFIIRLFAVDDKYPISH
jgi:hypothetical protein